MYIYIYVCVWGFLTMWCLGSSYRMGLPRTSSKNVLSLQQTIFKVIKQITQNWKVLRKHLLKCRYDLQAFCDKVGRSWELGVVTWWRHRSRRTLVRSTPSFERSDQRLQIGSCHKKPGSLANLQIFPLADLTSSCRFGAEFPQHVFNCHLFKDFKTICGTKTCPNVDLKTHIKLMYSNVLSHIKPH